MSDYEKLKQEYVKNCYQNEEVKPSGMAGNWSYRLKKEREFDEMYKKSNSSE